MTTPEQTQSDGEDVAVAPEPRRNEATSSAKVDEEPDAAVEDLIASFTEPDDAWRVSVYRLNEPGRADSASRRSFLATLPVTEDLLEVIRDMFGAGDYSLEFRQKGKVRKKAIQSIAPLRTVEVEDEALEDEATGSEQAERLDRIESVLVALATQTAQSNGNGQAASAQPNPMVSLREAMKLMREMKALDDEMKPTNGSRAPQGDDEERAWMMLLKDPTLRTRIAGSLTAMLGSVESGAEVSWYDKTIAVFAQQPHLANRAFNLFERVLPMKKEAEHQGDAESAANDEQGDAPDIAEILGYVVSELQSNAAVTSSVEVVFEFVETNAEHAPVIETLLGQASPLVIVSLKQSFPAIASYVDVPHAEAWIDAFKVAMTKRRVQRDAAQAIRAGML
jgi:hypothetical protein